MFISAPRLLLLLIDDVELRRLLRLLMLSPSSLFVLKIPGGSKKFAKESFREKGWLLVSLSLSLASAANIAGGNKKFAIESSSGALMLRREDDFVIVVAANVIPRML